MIEALQFCNFSPFRACAGALRWLKVGFWRGQGWNGPRAASLQHFPRASRGTGCGTVGRIAQLVEQRTENPRTHFLLSFAIWHYH